MLTFAFLDPRLLRGAALAAALALSGLPGQDKVYPPGVDAAIEDAIRRGLGFLARSQNDDGSWRSSGGAGNYPVAMTALAGMAFLGVGSTPTRGRYWRELRGAIGFLLGAAQPSGLITVPGEEARSMYGHGFGTMFLAQVYGMEEDLRRQEEIRRVLVKAVELIVTAQSKAGGWYYWPSSENDEGSVTVTQIQALRACRNAGVAVPAETVAAAVAYIRRSANPDGGIRYRAGSPGGSRPPITAAAVAVLYDAGRYDDPVAEKALRYARRRLPVTGSGPHHYYGQLYLAQALYQAGGEAWDDHYAEVSAWLRRQQSADGSWMGDDVGTTYGTAVALIILQLPYAYVPLYQR